MNHQERNKRLFGLRWLVAAVGIVCLAAGASSQPPDESTGAGDQARLKQLREEIEIMSRLIDRRMGEKFKDNYVAESYFSKGCEGFYVPDTGAVFVLRVKFPVFLEKPGEVEEIKAEEMDLWEQEKWRLRLGAGETGDRGTKLARIIEDHRSGISGEAGVPAAIEVRTQENEKKITTFGVTSERPPHIEVRTQENEKKIRDLKREILDILARYGRRIGSLAQDEKIVVAVLGGTGRPPIAFTVSSVRPEPRLPGRGMGMGNMLEPLSGYSMGYGLYGVAPHRREGLGTTLVISVRISELPLEPPAEPVAEAVWAETLAY